MPTRRPAAGKPGLRRAAAIAAACLLVLLAGWWWTHRKADEAGGYRTTTVERGDIRVAISATGTLSAISTVTVGSQVSGQVTDVLVDFNDKVTKGQVIAKIDPSTYEAQIEQGNAQIASAQAQLRQAQASLRNAKLDYGRKAALGDQQLVAKSDVDLARAALDQAQAQVNSAQAQIRQQTASTQTTRVNLNRTVIRSPVDGVILTRSIEPGQTVAASLQAPTLYTIAADLRNMRLKASNDESDLGSIKTGQLVTFRVDAYPNDTFRGRVEQIRLTPVIESNVVTYAAMISAPNPELKLKPGMTATLNVETARKDDVLRVPSAALRFRPTAAMLAALGGPEADSGAQGAKAKPTATAGRSTTPAQATLWVYDGDSLSPVKVTAGISDATFTEIVAGDIQEGTVLATRVNMAGTTTTAAPSAPSNNPLMGQQPRRF
jgi:HlyD family secretion protein